MRLRPGTLRPLRGTRCPRPHSNHRHRIPGHLRRRPKGRPIHRHRPQIAQAPRPPIVIIAPVVNRSASPIDTSLYTSKLRGTLMQYGGGKVQFLARDASAATNEREQQLRESGAVQSGGTAQSGRVAATYDYVLTAELQGISTASREGASDYFLVSFKLVDFNDLLLWENQYEIKKEGRESGVYR
ncbi:MAG: hypothetical protein HC904_11955 [Blastochloris sp.]|nr:hypothetical protein [Blastochloris sp.]